jgi:NAD+ synthase (glutamine-hydrolysing)
MKIAACALNQIPLDWEGNLSRILDCTESAKKAGVEVLLFPELALTGYGCEDYFFMPWLYEKAFDLLVQKLVPASKGIFLAVGIPFQKEGKNYNCLALCADGELKGLYAKQILAKTGVFYESRWFEPGKSLAVDSIERNNHSFLFGDFSLLWKGFRIGFEICEDGWHPSLRPAVCGAAREADLILNPSASNYARGKQEERHAIIHSLEGKNDAYYLYANLLGNESGRLIFDGEILFGSEGKVLGSTQLLSMKDTEMAVFEMDGLPQEPCLAPQLNDFEEFTAAASLGLLDYLRKSGSRGFALSLSGGADSAACAVLVTEMIRRALDSLGKEGLSTKLGFALKGNTVKELVNELLVCVYQATENSGTITLNAAKTVAEELGAGFYQWQIDPLVEGYTKLTESALGRQLDWEKDDLVLQNIQARSRAPGIWMLANTKNFLLLTTSNRSEGDVGYCTMDGDTAGSLAPIAGVSKHFIRQWLVWAKETLGYSSLELIINQQPTAELRPQEQKQTDEADLMPYDLLEQIEIARIGERKSRDEVVLHLLSFRKETREYLETQVDRFIILWKRSQWKRERLAPSFHLDRFNIDPKSAGRFPILSR